MTYGVVSKGNGDAFLMEEKHMSLSIGGGQAGQGYPCICYALDHVITTGGNCTAQGPCVYKEKCPTLKASGVHAVCYKEKK